MKQGQDMDDYSVLSFLWHGSIYTPINRGFWEIDCESNCAQQREGRWMG